MTFSDSARLGVQGLELLKDLKQTVNDHLHPPSTALIKGVIREMKFLLQEITKTIDEETNLGSAQTYKIKILHNTIKHYKKCLVAYALHRTKLVEQRIARGPRLEPGELEVLGEREQEYAQQYSAILSQTVHSAYPQLDWQQVQVQEPPGDLYLLVKVVKECGEIVTERGILALHPGTIVNVMRSEVGELLRTGHLEEL
jgi:GINS complex subunit 1